MRNKLIIIGSIATVLLFTYLFFYTSFGKVEVGFQPVNTFNFPKNLSELNLFKRQMKNLTPAKGVQVYKLASSLFTDYAEKQRLIKLPDSTKIIKQNDDMLNFPEGAIVAKTFYYFKDKRTPSLGKNIIETRLLVKHKNKWNVGTYLWNKEQTNATYIEDGYDTNVDWVDLKGNPKSLASYHVPTSKECTSCHQINKEIVLIGPKIKNLNRDILIHNTSKNQLSHFQDTGTLDDFPLNNLQKLPSYKDETLPINDRARAYLDINCAHCHTKGGMASYMGFEFDYNTPLFKTEIDSWWGKHSIVEQMKTKQMPLVGTSVVDEEGLKLITEYINSID